MGQVLAQALFRIIEMGANMAWPRSDFINKECLTKITCSFNLFRLIWRTIYMAFGLSSSFSLYKCTLHRNKSQDYRWNGVCSSYWALCASLFRYSPELVPFVELARISKNTNFSRINNRPFCELLTIFRVRLRYMWM